MDKIGIVVTAVIVAFVLGFLATGGTGIPSDIPPTVEKTIVPIKEAGQQTTEKLKELSKSGTQIVKEAKELGQTAKELTASKLPSRLVSIPKGTAVPGCEKDGICYDPPSLIIFKGGEIIWRNDDSSTHYVTSGDYTNGPNGKFSSGLIMPKETFSFKFNEPGVYDYYCSIHSWAKASITVK